MKYFFSNVYNGEMDVIKFVEMKSFKNPHFNNILFKRVSFE